ncbi:MAG TPA: PAS domain-containing protein [Acetobacteraceae bacterium]|nr:PAS domain-containing protein [Acetobacteraceae bacterium]
MRRAWRDSLRLRLLSLIALVSLPPIAFETLQLAQMHRRDHAAVEREARLLAHRFAVEQDRIVEGARQLLSAASALHSIRTMNAEICNVTFRQIAAQFPTYVLLSAASVAEERTFCSSHAAGLHVGDRRWFRLALEVDGFVVAEQIAGRQTGRRVLNFAQPVRGEDGRTIAVLNAALDLDRMAEALAAVPLPSAAALVVADRNGMVLASLPDRGLNGRSLPPPLEALVATAGDTVVEADWAGARRITAVISDAASAADGIFVAVGLDGKQALAAERGRAWSSILVAGAAALLAALIALWFCARHVLRPIEHLRGAAEAFEQGNLPVRSRIGGASELRRLGHAFESMAAAVELREARFRGLAEAVPSMAFETDATGANTWTAAAWHRYTGLTAGAALGDGWQQVVHPEDLPTIAEGWKAAVRTGSAFGMRMRVRRADGAWRWHLVRAVPARGARGTVLRWVGSATDIHDLVEAQHTLAEAEERLRLAVEGAGLATWDFDVGSEDVRWSHSHFTLLGYEPHPEGHAKLSMWSSRVHPDDMPSVMAACEQVIVAGGSVRVTYRAIRLDGETIWIEAHGSVLATGDGRRRFLGVMKDITAERAALDRLAETEERLRLAIEGTDEGLWDTDLVTGRAWASDRYYTMLGYRPGELDLNVETWHELIHPDDMKTAMRVLTDHLEGRTPAMSAEYRMRHRDGRWVWVLDRGKVVARDRSGRPLRAVGTHQDITRRKMAEDALAASEAQLRAVLDTVPECVKVVDAQGFLASINAAGRQMIQAGQDTVLDAAAAASLVAEPDRPAWLAHHARVCAGQPDALEFGIVGLHGVCRRVHSQGLPMRLTDGSTGYLGVTRDVTERREAEARLRSLQAEAMRASRIGAVGAMAAGLAHELNQPLGAIANYASAASMRLDAIAARDAALAGDVSGVRRVMDRITGQAVRAGDIVRRLRDFVGEAEPELATLPAALLAERACVDARAALEGQSAGDLRFGLHAEVQPGTGDIYGDGVQLQLVLANLIRNAAEAVQVRTDGRIVVAARRVEEGVEFTVSDNGPGIGPRSLDRLFEPFSSSKPGGMGVGLAISRTIVEAHGGRIWAVAQGPHGGAAFHFTIPDPDRALRGAVEGTFRSA